MGRPRKYDWDELFEAARARTGFHASDFDTELRTFQIQAGNAARAAGIHLSTRTCKSHKKCLWMHAKVQTRWDWDKYLDGRWHPVWYRELKVQPESFRRMLRAAAAKKGYRVMIDEKPERGGMQVRAFSKEGS